MRALLGATSIALGGVLLAAVVVLYAPPFEDVGGAPGAATSTPAPPGDPASSAVRPDSPAAPGLPPEDAAVTRPPAPGRPDPATDPADTPVRFDAMPTRISVPAIEVDHPLVPVGLEPDGAMEIPHDVQQIGWYSVQGVLPGDPGTAVLAGHVDSRSQGPGAFYDLRHLDVGDEVEIRDGARVQEWVVTARRSYDKDLLPVDDIFVVDGPPRLALITCGGTFDRTARSYQDNIVVYATLR